MCSKMKVDCLLQTVCRDRKMSEFSGMKNCFANRVGCFLLLGLFVVKAVCGGTKKKCLYCLFKWNDGRYDITQSARPLAAITQFHG